LCCWAGRDTCQGSADAFQFFFARMFTLERNPS
jgi:hypothetical protein